MKNKKEDIKFHEEMRQGSRYIYKNGAPMAEGYTQKGAPVENKESGFYAEVWQKGNDVVIIYRGSEDIIDYGLKNDLRMVLSKLPVQAIDALKLYDKVKRENPNANITVTGHSLGGSLAQIVSAVRGAFAVTFNAYGTKNMFNENQKLNTDNIVNYINEHDPISMPNADNQIGDSYAVQHMGGFGHYVESMGPLSGRQPRSSEELKRHKNLFNRGINRAKYKIHQAAAKCAGSYPVSGYTRDDGTKVQGYTRTCGAKHSG